MKGKAFTALGALLILFSLYFSYVELQVALEGQAEAWMALSALVCAGVLGVGMVNVGRTARKAEVPPATRTC